jgi:carbon-monoxide dehydrogenase large subunit
MVRSPHAHALIRTIAAEKALALPGVLAVLTGADFLADGLKPIPHKPWSPHPAEIVAQQRRQRGVHPAALSAAGADKARFVGEAVAMVVAETLPAAKDGAERVEVDYEISAGSNRNDGSDAITTPRVHEGAHSNVCIDAEIGDATATAASLRAPPMSRASRPAARHRRADGAARRARRVRSRKRALHGLCRQRWRGAVEERHCRHPRRTR